MIGGGEGLRQEERPKSERERRVGGRDGCREDRKGVLLFIGPRDTQVWCFCGPDGAAGEGTRLRLPGAVGGEEGIWMSPRSMKSAAQREPGWLTLSRAFQPVRQPAHLPFPCRFKVTTALTMDILPANKDSFDVRISLGKQTTRREKVGVVIMASGCFKIRFYHWNF